MIIEGKILGYPRDNINTDEIIPARYLNTSDPDQLAAHCLEDLDHDFFKKKSDLDASILVVGSNMGCGSSREHAPIAIKNARIQAVIAKSFARIFFRNSINIGLPIFECHDDGFSQIIADGDKIRIDVDAGFIEHISSGKKYQIQKMPVFLQEIINAGGLIEYAKKLVG
ncbi:MAG: 3-isopropylmalate dehydratase small subunit [Promethearchaeota archaeon]